MNFKYILFIFCYLNVQYFVRLYNLFINIYSLIVTRLDATPKDQIY